MRVQGLDGIVGVLRELEVSHSLDPLQEKALGTLLEVSEITIRGLTSRVQGAARLLGEAHRYAVRDQPASMPSAWFADVDAWFENA